jgi:hypothetical protein
MNIITFVSRDWDDYNVLIRKMTVLIEDMTKKYPDDKKIIFIHTAQNVGENMITEYVGKIRGFMSQKGYNVDEKVVYYKKFSDIDIIDRGADHAIVFSKQGCQRTEKCTKILSISNIPTTLVRG